MEIKLREFAGQRTEVVLSSRQEGSWYVNFRSEPGYGAPCLEEAKLRELLSLIEKVKGVLAIDLSIDT